MAWTVSLFMKADQQAGSLLMFIQQHSSRWCRNQQPHIGSKDASEITFVDQTVNSVVWTAQEQSDAFFAYVDQDKYLSTRKGQYAERNGALYPWVNKFDLKLQQDFFIKVAGKRNIIQVTFDILNVGNLLNKKWGNVWSYKQNNILVMTNNNAVTAGGTTVPTFRLNPYNNTHD